MGLVRGMARTAVIAGTATAVSNRVSRRQANRWAAQDPQQAVYAEPGYPPQQYAPQQYAPQQYAPPPPPPPPPPAPPAAEENLSTQLERLAQLRAQGVLTEDEFAAAKARLLEP